MRPLGRAGAVLVLGRAGLAAGAGAEWCLAAQSCCVAARRGAVNELSLSLSPFAQSLTIDASARRVILTVLLRCARRRRGSFNARFTVRVLFCQRSDVSVALAAVVDTETS